MADLKDIQLSSDDILKKQFRNKVKGYDPDEVDAYLDQVISDYETFHQIIEDLYGQIGNLQRELMDAKKKQTSAPKPQENEDVKTYTPRRRKPVVHVDENDNENQGEISTNMAIIQRISTLERKVYNLEQRVYGLQK
ncbi:DivIVA domain-containing protein [Lactobacillus agrestimuris]|uniref:DivIVA domain-containing protein n=1 Tax=Lactobacillus agrestimuris TaxID=2941328 RepID=UPI00199A0CE1|nr:DivIVA domain-containing protein [Lactobacillus agrestimuris]MBD5430923.1 DivIVA domain-containing protein [Lactobacillus sp.]